MTPKTRVATEVLQADLLQEMSVISTGSTPSRKFSSVDRFGELQNLLIQLRIPRLERSRHPGRKRAKEGAGQRGLYVKAACGHALNVEAGTLRRLAPHQKRDLPAIDRIASDAWWQRQSDTRGRDCLARAYCGRTPATGICLSVRDVCAITA